MGDKRKFYNVWVRSSNPRRGRWIIWAKFRQEWEAAAYAKQIASMNQTWEVARCQGRPAAEVTP